MKIALRKVELIAIANQELKARAGYKEGMRITNAEMKDHVLVLYGDGIISKEGGFHADTAEVFNSFVDWFSKRYTLIE
ncbi:DUF2498 family protein [Pseudomonas sp. RIT-PI-AD]|uniref:DUF2498 family protein n=1 Tax=Pseudomonas sp. RIT-PI-AD TaxID=3035294 RepID=UPI0021D94C24|nr:DUF2498 family protein [Pseudomonas sp. RIT-PI-AD]